MNNRLQILPNPQRASYARCKVQVYASLNGNMAVYYGNQHLDTCPAPPESAKLRVPITAGQSALRWSPKFGQVVKIGFCSWNKKRREEAGQLKQYYGTTAKFWLELQTDYDLDVAADELGECLEREVTSYVISG